MSEVAPSVVPGGAFGVVLGVVLEGRLGGANGALSEPPPSTRQRRRAAPLTLPAASFALTKKVLAPSRTRRYDFAFAQAVKRAAAELFRLQRNFAPVSLSKRKVAVLLTVVWGSHTGPEVIFGVGGGVRSMIHLNVAVRLFFLPWMARALNVWPPATRCE